MFDNMFDNLNNIKITLLRKFQCSLDSLARGPLGPRASGSKLYKTEGLFGQSGRAA